MTNKRRKAISIEFIQNLDRERRKINRLKLDDIAFTVCGQPVAIDPKTIEEFRFTGLSNMDFILSGFYKEQPNE